MPGVGSIKWEKNVGLIVVEPDDISAAVHEYAHRLQAALPELDDLFQQLHRRRVEGDPVRRLKDIIPGARYDDDELTREDKYVHPYQGKEYAKEVVPGDTNVPPGAASEVMTIALEYILGMKDKGWGAKHTAKKFSDMYTKDREMFDFTVGVLMYWKP